MLADVWPADLSHTMNVALACDLEISSLLPNLGLPFANTVGKALL